jgi:hypothetical protein
MLPPPPPARDGPTAPNRRRESTRPWRRGQRRGTRPTSIAHHTVSISTSYSSSSASPTTSHPSSSHSERNQPQRPVVASSSGIPSSGVARPRGPCPASAHRPLRAPPPPPRTPSVRPAPHGTPRATPPLALRGEDALRCDLLPGGGEHLEPCALGGSDPAERDLGRRGWRERATI